MSHLTGLPGSHLLFLPMVSLAFSFRKREPCHIPKKEKGQSNEEGWMNYVLMNENSLLGPARNDVRKYHDSKNHANIMESLTFLY